MWCNSGVVIGWLPIREISGKVISLAYVHAYLCFEGTVEPV